MSRLYILYQLTKHRTRLIARNPSPAHELPPSIGHEHANPVLHLFILLAPPHLKEGYLRMGEGSILVCLKCVHHVVEDAGNLLFVIFLHGEEPARVLVGVWDQVEDGLRSVPFDALPLCRDESSLRGCI